MKIITDSTADLPKELIIKHNVGIVPLTIHLGDRSGRIIMMLNQMNITDS